jgi:hypothetical protein
MRSVADQLRAAQRRRVAALAPARCLALALALGERDLALFRAAHRPEPSRDAAIRELRLGHQQGRRPSACARPAGA